MHRSEPMTVAEYAEWGVTSESPDSRDELIDGVIVPLLPHYVMHGLANGLLRAGPVF